MEYIIFYEGSFNNAKFKDDAAAVAAGKADKSVVKIVACKQTRTVYARAAKQ